MRDRIREQAYFRMRLIFFSERIIVHRMLAAAF